MRGRTELPSYFDSKEQYLAARASHIENMRQRKRARDRARKERTVRATPSWADMVEIELFYRLCPPGYEVDHVIPINGKFVSGLHVESNLQYLTPEANSAKSNHYTP